MKAPRTKPRKTVSTKSKTQINLNYLIIFFVLTCIFAAFQCDAQNIVAPCHLRVLHISWIYRYPKAILCLMSRNINEFFKRIILSPIYLLQLILCFFKSLILPILSWLYFSFFAPIINIFEGIRYTIKSLALTFPHLFLIPLYIIKFLLYPFKWLVSLVSPYAYNECHDNPLKCIGHQTAHIFYIPIRATDNFIRTIDEWIQILLDQIKGDNQDENTFDNDQNNTLIQEEERKRREEEEEERKRKEKEEEERKRREKEEEEEERKRREKEEEEERKRKEKEEEERKRREKEEEEEERKRREKEEEEERKRREKEEEEERKRREKEEEERKRKEKEERKRKEEEERKRREKEEEEERKRREEEERLRKEEEERLRKEEEERKRREEEERKRKEEEERLRKEEEERLRKEEEERRRREEEERKRKEEEERRRKEEEEERRRREEEERRRKEEEERNKHKIRKEDYNDLVKRYDRVEENVRRANQLTHEKLGCTKDNCDD